MKSTRTVTLCLLITVVVIICSGVTAWQYVQQKQTALLDTINGNIATQEIALYETMKLLDRNGATDEINVIVRDCSSEKRNQFDALLAKLDAGLSNEQLLQLKTLFDQCGNFYALRRSIMATQLENQVTQYDMLLSLYARIAEDETSANKGTVWHDLSDKQLKISTHFARLVAIQGEIIDELLDGKQAGAQSIKTLLDEAQGIQDTIGVLNIEINNVRANAESS